MLGAVCIAFMTAGKVSFVSADASASLAIFIALQMLGVTIVKAGLDSYVFAQASTQQKNDLYNFRPVFSKVLVYFWIAISIASYFYIGSWLGIVIYSASVICDSYSAVRTSEFTARRQFHIVAASNMLKYPLYFLILFSIGSFIVIEYEDLLYLFVFTSLVRSFFLLSISRKFSFQSLPSFSFGILGAQQVLNYLLFRLDQVGIPLLSGSISTLDSKSINDFVFLIKYPELVSYFAAASGSIVFPRLLDRWHSTKIDITRERLLINFGLFFVCGIGLIIYLLVLQRDPYGFYVYLPLVLAACLSFEVNFITFKLLSSNSFARLLICLLIGFLFGIIFLFLTKITQIFLLTYWIVPIQMIVFLIIYNRTDKIK